MLLPRARLSTWTACPNITHSPFRSRHSLVWLIRCTQRGSVLFARCDISHARLAQPSPSPSRRNGARSHDETPGLRLPWGGDPSRTGHSTTLWSSPVLLFTAKPYEAEQPQGQQQCRIGFRDLQQIGATPGRGHKISLGIQGAVHGQVGQHRVETQAGR